MKKSVFDSKAEEEIFHRLKRVWCRHVEVFPQLPPRNVFGYKEIMGLDISKKAKDFLLKTAFDFVVCDIKSHTPLLVIEFDGISGGFSKEAEYFIKTINPEDPYRSLKMETKLKACSQLDIPAIVVSYDECSILKESEQMITILDVIIADAVEKADHAQNYGKYIEMLTDAYEYGGDASIDNAMIEIDAISEMSNPIKQKIREMTKKFPRWGYQFLFAQPDKNGFLNGTFRLTMDITTINGVMYTKELLSVDISIRQVGTFTSDPIFLFNTLGEYCLARKTEKVLGYDWQKWKEANENASWSKM